MRWSPEALAAYEKGKAEVLKSIPEADHLKTCLAFLQSHPKVAWAVRMNTGMWETDEGRRVRFGFIGCADIIGQLKDGRFMAFECKRVGNKPTDSQKSFLNKVWSNGGVSGWGQMKHAEGMLHEAKTV